MISIEIKLTNIDLTIQNKIKNRVIGNKNVLAPLMKKRRVELGYTLQDVCDNICSPAYLSKVENNKMYPDIRRTELLFEKLDLDYCKVMKLENSDVVKEILYLAIDEKEEDIMNFEVETIEDTYIAQNEIVFAYQAYFRKDYNSLAKIIKGLDTIKDCLTEIELFALLFIVYKFNILALQLNKALNYLNLLAMLKIDDEKIKKLLKQEYFIIACKMNSENAYYLFREIRTYFNGFSLTKQFYFNIIYTETLANNETFEYLTDLKNDFIPSKYKNEYEYANALILTKLNKNKEALDLIKSQNSKETRFAALYAYNLVIMTKPYEFKTKEDLLEKFDSEYETLVELVKNAEQNGADTYHLGFLRLMQFELDLKKKGDICNYIKDNILKVLKDYSYPIYDDYINQRYCDLLGELSRYKDAYLFLVEHKNNLKK